MDSDSYAVQLSRKLGLENSVEHIALQKAFLARAGALMVPGTMPMEEADEEIRAIFKLYGYYNSEYIKSTCARAASKTKDYPDAGSVKSNAGGIAQGLYAALGEFCVCVLDLNAVKARLAKEMEAAKARGGEEQKDVEWTHDLPGQIAISVRRRDALSRTLSQMNDADRIVFLLDSVLNFMTGSLYDLLGEEKTKGFMNDYTGRLRTRKPDAAKTLIVKRAETETSRFFLLKKKEKKRKWALLIEIAELIGQLIRKCQQSISSSEGGVFLKKREFDRAYEDIEKQLKKSQDFIAKYELPEMRYRYDALERQQKILNGIGPFEEKLQMIEQMEMSCHSPMPTMKDVKTFEAGLYKEALKFMDQDSIEIENISNLVRELAQGPDPGAVSDEEIASARIGD